ncbi:hypothetical protein F4703DRAFT_1737163, partial [Phycomyces blakesleeanus]
NIWFDLLHRTISCGSLLRRVMPTIVVIPECPLCTHLLQTPKYLLTTCPKVWPVWAPFLS